MSNQVTAPKRPILRNQPTQESRDQGETCATLAASARVQLRGDFSSTGSLVHWDVSITTVLVEGQLGADCVCMEASSNSVDRETLGQGV